MRWQEQPTVLFQLVLALVLAGCTAVTTVSFPTRSTIPWGKPEVVTGLLFRPKNEGTRPAVILLHACGGMRPHVTQDWPQYLTELGYVVLTVDSYGPRGASRCTDLGPGHYDMQANDAYGALNHLAGLPFVDPDRVAVIGFSSGALAINDSIVNNTPRDGQRNFKAAIAFYGRCTDIGARRNPRVALMQIVADKDVLHAESCIYAGKRYPIRVQVLRDTYHAFDQTTSRGQTDPFGSVMLYSGGAVAEASDHVKSFLAEHLGK